MADASRIRLRLTEIIRRPGKDICNNFVEASEPKQTRTHWLFEFRGFRELPDLASIAQSIRDRFAGTASLRFETDQSEPVIKVIVPRSYAYYSPCQRLQLFLAGVVLPTLVIFIYCAKAGYASPF